MYPRMQWIVRDGCGFRNYKPHPAPMTLFIVGELGALGFRTGFRKADLHHKSIAAAFFGAFVRTRISWFQYLYFPRSFFVSSRKTPVMDPMNRSPAAMAPAVRSVSLAVSAKASSECSRIASIL